MVWVALFEWGDRFTNVLTSASVASCKIYDKRAVTCHFLFDGIGSFSVGTFELLGFYQYRARYPTVVTLEAASLATRGMLAPLTPVTVSHNFSQVFGLLKCYLYISSKFFSLAWHQKLLAIPHPLVKGWVTIIVCKNQSYFLINFTWFFSFLKDESLSILPLGFLKLFVKHLVWVIPFNELLS